MDPSVEDGGWRKRPTPGVTHVPPRLRRLDPRPEEKARLEPLAETVNIPLDELPDRTHELPPRDDELIVVGPAPWRDRAIEWLHQHERRAIAGDAPLALNPLSGRLWTPTAFLEETLPTLGLPVGANALDVACGAGRDAVFLAMNDLSVTAVDRLTDALELGRDLEKRYLHAPPHIDWRCVDLERDPLDLGGPFQLVTIFRYLQRPLLIRLREWLKPGGIVLVETFTREHRARHGKPRREELTLEANELPRLMSDFEIIHYSEGWRGNIHTARICASQQV